MLSQLLVSALPGWPHPSHLSHRHSLWWAALQKDLMIQGHLLCQRLLVKVLAQVCEEKSFKSIRLRAGREHEVPIVATRGQSIPKDLFTGCLHLGKQGPLKDLA